MLDEVPEWRDYLARLDEARERHNHVASEGMRADVAYADAVAAHRRRVEEAVGRGDPIPTDEPARSESHAHALRFSLSVLSDLDKEGQSLRVALVDDVERIASARWRARRAEIREAVATLTLAAREHSADAVQLAQLRDAANHAKPAPIRPSPSERMRTNWGLEQLADAVRRDVHDPHALAALSPHREGHITRGDGPPESSPPRAPRPLSRYGYPGH